MLGEVIGVEEPDASDAEEADPDWRRRKGNFRLGRRNSGKIGLVAEMRLSLSLGILSLNRTTRESALCLVLEPMKNDGRKPSLEGRCKTQNKVHKIKSKPDKGDRNPAGRNK